MMDRVAIIAAVVGGLGLLWLVVELRSPVGPRVNPRAPQPPSMVVVALRGTDAPQPPAAQRIDVHHHHHLVAAAWPSVLDRRRQAPEVIDGEVVDALQLPRGGRA